MTESDVVSRIVEAFGWFCIGWSVGGLIIWARRRRDRKEKP